MKAAWRLAGWCAAIALVAYFIRFAFQSVSSDVLLSAVNQPRILVSLVVAVLCYAAIYPATGYAWRVLLMRQGTERSVWELTRLVGITQLAKYIPGNIAQHATRASLSLRQGVPVQPFVASVLQESALALIASLLVGICALALTGTHLNLESYRWMLHLLIFGALIGLLIFCVDLHPSSCTENKGIVWKLIRILGGLPGPAATFTAATIYAFNYLLIAFGIWLLSRSLGLSWQLDYAMVAAAFCLSWAVGFLTPGAPAGLGTREGVMLFMLAGHGGNEQIVLLILLSRTANMVADFCVFIVAIAPNSTKNCRSTSRRRYESRPRNNR